MRPTSFYLAIGDDGQTDTFQNQGAAVGLAGACGWAEEVYLCIPTRSGGYTMDCVTETLARLWWRESVDARDMRSGATPADLNAVPLAYRDALEMDIDLLTICGPERIPLAAIDTADEAETTEREVA